MLLLLPKRRFYERGGGGGGGGVHRRPAAFVVSAVFSDRPVAFDGQLDRTLLVACLIPANHGRFGGRVGRR